MLPSLTYKHSEAKIQAIFDGNWFTRDLKKVLPILEKRISGLEAKIPLQLTFADTFKLDTAGAWVIARWIKSLEAHKINVDKSKLPQDISTLLDKNYCLSQPSQDNSWSAILVTIGQKSTDFFNNILSIVTYLGEMVSTLFSPSLKGPRLRGVSIVHHIFATGIQAIPIVALISFLIGAVLAYQGINQLNRFGASVYTVDFLAISLCREIAVLITSVVIAGRSGSAFTAQIGTMALNQEIDAIRMLGLNPMVVLAIPRIIALCIALPILVFLAVLFGLIGGMVITSLIIDMPYIQYWQAANKAISFSTFMVGMSKSPLFAVIISLIGCYRGMQVKGSAESVGIMTTRSVVESIFLVIVFDALMSIFFSIMDW